MIVWHKRSKLRKWTEEMEEEKEEEEEETDSTRDSAKKTIAVQW